MACKIEAVMLGLDPAKHTSGAVLLEPDTEDGPFAGQYVLAEYGKVITQAERERFVQSLLDAALELELAPVVVAEIWDPPRDRRVRLPDGSFVFVKDPKWTYETILGIGAGWGMWEAEILHANDFLAEEGLPPLPVVRVLPNDWRDAVFSTRRPKDTEALKVTAERYFKGIFGFDVASDIAEAGCIGLWGTTSDAVALAVKDWLDAKAGTEKPKKKRRRKAS